MAINFDELFQDFQTDFVKALKPMPNINNKITVDNTQSEESKYLIAVENTSNEIINSMQSTQQTLICSIKQQIQQKMEEKQLYVLMEQDLGCDAYTDHLKPKNIYPLYQKQIDDILGYFEQLSIANVRYVVQNSLNKVILTQIQQRVQTEANLIQEQYKTKTLEEYTAYLLDQIKSQQVCLNTIKQKSNRALKMLEQQLRLKGSMPMLYSPDYCKKEQLDEPEDEDLLAWGNKVQLQKVMINQLQEIAQQQEAKIAQYNALIKRLKSVGLNPEDMNEMEKTVKSLLKQREEFNKKTFENEEAALMQIDRMQEEQKVKDKSYEQQIDNLRRELQDLKIQKEFETVRMQKQLYAMRENQSKSTMDENKTEGRTSVKTLKSIKSNEIQENAEIQDCSSLIQELDEKQTQITLVEREIQTVIDQNYQDESVQTGETAQKHSSLVPISKIIQKAQTVLDEKLDEKTTIVNIFDKLYNEAKILREKKEKLREEYKLQMMRKQQNKVQKQILMSQSNINNAFVSRMPVKKLPIIVNKPKVVQESEQSVQNVNNFSILIKSCRQAPRPVLRNPSFAFDGGEDGDE